MVELFPAISDVVNFMTRFCAVETLNMLEEIVGSKVFGCLVRQSGLILFSACMNGQLFAIEWAMNTVQKYGTLATELNRIYDIWDGKKSTLLLFLCFMNMQDVKAIELLRKKGFDHNLLAFTLDGKNALETSILYRNTEAVTELLKNPTWARVLMPSQEAVNQILAMLGNEPQDVELQYHVVERFNAVWGNS